MTVRASDIGAVGEPFDHVKPVMAVTFHLFLAAIRARRPDLKKRYDKAAVWFGLVDERDAVVLSGWTSCEPTPGQIEAFIAYLEELAVPRREFWLRHKRPWIYAPIVATQRRRPDRASSTPSAAPARIEPAPEPDQPTRSGASRMNLEAQTTEARLALEPNLGDARRFLELLDADADHFVFQTFDDTTLKSRSLVKTWRGALDEMAAPLARLQAGGAGVFVTVNECALGRRRAVDVTRVRAVFADLDGAPLPPVMACALEPHVVVESSPGRYHAYWLVEDVSLDQFTPLQKAIAARFGGDKSVNDLPRVMRLPGFWHQKEAPFLSRIVQVNERLPYSLDELLAEFPPVEATMVSSWRGWERPACGMVDANAELHWFSRLSARHQGEELERMLDHLTADEFGEYDLWLKISFAVYRATNSMGFEIWDAWCRKLPNYDEAGNLKKWQDGLRYRDGPIVTVGTLIMLARQHGYQPPDVWAAASSLAGIARLYSPEELAGLDARFMAGLAKRRMRS